MYKWKWITYTGSRLRLPQTPSGNRIYSGFSGFPGIMTSMIERVIYSPQNQGSISDHRRLKRWPFDCQLSALTTVYIVNHTLSHFTSYSAHWQAAPNLDLNVSERLTFQQGLNLTSNYFERTASIKPSDHYRLSITCLVFSALTCSDTFYKAATLPWDCPHHLSVWYY